MQTCDDHLVIGITEEKLDMETIQPLTNVCLSFNCPMKWNRMKSISKSKRHCQQCQCVVTDFRNVSQEEFDVALKKSRGHLCGRSTKFQLSASFLIKIATTATLVACNTEYLMEPKSTKESSSVFLDEFAPDSKLISDTKAFELTGIVFIPDSVDAEINEQHDE